MLSRRLLANLSTAAIVHGKELSYNNLLDLIVPSVWSGSSPGPRSVFLKHNIRMTAAAVGLIRSTAFDTYEGDSLRRSEAWSASIVVSTSRRPSGCVNPGGSSKQSSPRGLTTMLFSG